MNIKRDELFQAARWLNLILGLMNFYLFSLGGGHHLLGLAVLNIAVWALTRKHKDKDI